MGECITQLEDEDSDTSQERARDDILSELLSCSGWSLLHSIVYASDTLSCQHSLEYMNRFCPTSVFRRVFTESVSMGPHVIPHPCLAIRQLIRPRHSMYGS